MESKSVIEVPRSNGLERYNVCPPAVIYATAGGSQFFLLCLLPQLRTRKRTGTGRSANLFHGAPLQSRELRASLRQRGRSVLLPIHAPTQSGPARVNSCP